MSASQFSLVAAGREVFADLGLEQFRGGQPAFHESPQRQEKRDRAAPVRQLGQEVLSDSPDRQSQRRALEHTWQAVLFLTVMGGDGHITIRVLG